VSAILVYLGGEPAVLIPLPDVHLKTFPALTGRTKEPNKVLSTFEGVTFNDARRPLLGFELALVVVVCSRCWFIDMTLIEVTIIQLMVRVAVI